MEYVGEMGFVFIHRRPSAHVLLAMRSLIQAIGTKVASPSSIKLAAKPMM
jgi:hypothetical protein